MGFGLVIESIGHFDTARDYTLQITITHTLASAVTFSLQLLGSGFQRRTFPLLWVPNCPRRQLPASNSNSSHRLNPRSSLNAAANWSWLKHLGTDSIENVSSLLLCSLVAVETCFFAEPYLAMAVVLFLILWSFPSNESTCHSIQISQCTYTQHTDQYNLSSNLHVLKLHGHCLLLTINLPAWGVSLFPFTHILFFAFLLPHSDPLRH
jgi:hypothetical protein